LDLPARPSPASNSVWDDAVDAAPERFTPIPLKKTLLINRVAAGAPTEATDLDYPVNVADDEILIPNELVDGCFALRIDGDSMLPVYQPGDIVIFSADRTPLDGDDCLVRLGDGDTFSTTFKRIHFVDASGAKQQGGEFLFLEPLNSAHTPRIVRREDLTGVYPALWKLSAVGRSV
jgi:SOS-response transcriptional repressor LexA